MDDELIDDDDRLTGPRLTTKEIERLRRDAKEALSFARESFRHNPPVGRDFEGAR